MAEASAVTETGLEEAAKPTAGGGGMSAGSDGSSCVWAKDSAAAGGCEFFVGEGFGGEERGGERGDGRWCCFLFPMRRGGPWGAGEGGGRRLGRRRRATAKDVSVGRRQNQIALLGE